MIILIFNFFLINIIPIKCFNKNDKYRNLIGLKMLLIFSHCLFLTYEKYREAKLISLLSRKNGRYHLSHLFNNDKYKLNKLLH